MKKNEDAAAKKKPKTSAAQIRVQKGRLIYYPRKVFCYNVEHRFDGIGSPFDNEDQLSRSRRSP
jgi:hypothetical protein